jgi:cytosine/adenosine deaminase-related metal-dependent hydrolase
MTYINIGHLTYIAKSFLNHLQFSKAFTGKHRVVDAGFHVHTAEPASGADACLREHGKRVVEWWRDAGLLGGRTIAVRCIHVNDREIDLLRESGIHADIILVDYDPPTPLHAANIVGHILFGFTGRSVTTTIIGGRIVMEDRKLLTIGEQEIMSKASASAAELWERF